PHPRATRGQGDRRREDREPGCRDGRLLRHAPLRERGKRYQDRTAHRVERSSSRYEARIGSPEIPISFANIKIFVVASSPFFSAMISISANVPRPSTVSSAKDAFSSR